MILFPPAKINIGLKVLFKRPDGYHELETIMMETPFTDVLEIVESDEFRFTQSGILIEGNEADNLCVKAYRLLQERHGIGPVHIHLQKHIPMGAGLGGGSADAAYVLSGLNNFFELNLSAETLENYAAELGSDCPFFIRGGAQLAKGRGEILSPIQLNLKGYYLYLLNIGIHVGTKEAYANVHFSAAEPSLATLIEKGIENWKETIFNDFEQSVFPLYPELASIKAQLYNQNAIYAGMSGSGSTLFAIFKEEPVTMNFTNAIEKILKF